MSPERQERLALVLCWAVELMEALVHGAVAGAIVGWLAIWFVPRG